MFSQHPQGFFFLLGLLVDTLVFCDFFCSFFSARGFSTLDCQAHTAVYCHDTGIITVEADLGVGDGRVCGQG